MLPAEFNTYTPKEGDSFDFSDFDEVIGPNKLPLMSKFIDMSKTSEDNRIFVLTSRAMWKPIAKYLNSIGANPKGITVVAIASSNPQDKADWIAKKVDNYGYEDVFFADDSIKNVNAVKNTLDKNNIEGEVLHIK